MKAVTPEQAADLVKQGALLIDVCEAAEFAHNHIAGARNLPLSRLSGAVPNEGEKAVIFYCASGMRTRMQSGRLASAARGRDVYHLSGGLVAWRRAGLPTARHPNGEPPSQGLMSMLGGLFR